MPPRPRSSDIATDEFCRLAGRLLSHPAAPYHEGAVRKEAERICAEHGLEYSRDKFGNLIVRLRTSRIGRPLVLAAHLDHPGFEILRRVRADRWLARFRGGVPDSFFRPGTAIRLMPGGTAAQLGTCRKKEEKLFEIQTRGPRIVPPVFGAWEMPDFALRRERLYARACDDLIGVTAILATLVGLKRTGARVHILGVLTRAEEVGFHGALTVASGATLPKDSMVISLETSRELPGVKMGRGVILRVGDRASIFDSEATRFLGEVAGGLATRKGFSFQRALMSGGTCEATAYQEFGFQCAAVCVALGNYHNCGPGNRIRPEYVSVSDACGMVELLAEAARQMPSYHPLVARLPQRLRKLLQEAKPRLRKSAPDLD